MFDVMNNFKEGMKIFLLHHRWCIEIQLQWQWQFFIDSHGSQQDIFIFVIIFNQNQTKRTCHFFIMCLYPSKRFKWSMIQQSNYLIICKMLLFATEKPPTDHRRNSSIRNGGIFYGLAWIIWPQGEWNVNETTH